MRQLLTLYRKLPHGLRAPLGRGFTGTTRELLRRSRLVRSGKVLAVAPLRPDDIFIASFPRSGNTLTRFLLANMLFPEVDVSLANIERLIPYLPALVTHDPRVAASPWPRFFKSHEVFYDAFPRMIYILRDGRDAMVSIYHLQCEQGEFAGSFSEYLKAPPTQVLGRVWWAEHVTQALDFQARHPERVLLLRYEELVKDLAGAARRIVDFAGITVEDEAIARAVEACALDRLKKGEAASSPDKHQTMFRKGKSGTWGDMFSTEEAAAFWAAHGALLSRLGYSEHAPAPRRVSGS